MFHKQYVDFAELIWEDFSYQIDNMQLKKGIREIMPYPRFTKISINHFLSIHTSVPKGLPFGLRTIKDDDVLSRMIVEVSDESDSEAARKQTGGRRVIKKKVLISAVINIIPELDVALELAKSMSLAEAKEEEATRRVHSTYERLVTESDEPSGANRPTGVLDESTVMLTTSSEGAGTKPGVPDEAKGTSEAKADVYFDEEEEKKDDDDDDKSIDIEETNEEETDDDFVHGDEYVQENVDEEMKDAEVVDTWNGDEEITNTTKADAEKIEEVKDDNKKAEIPLSSSSLFVSSVFGNQFLGLSYNKSIVGNLKDTTDAEINPLLDIQIQQEIPQIQSPSILTVHVLVLQKHTKELKKQYSQQVNYKDVIKESVQANIINEVKNLLPKFLPKAISDFATPMIQSIVKKTHEKTHDKHQTQSSLKAAESLSKYKLKTILFENMDKSRSYLTHDKHQALFDALFNSLCLDDVISCGQAEPEKVLRKRDHDGDDKDEDHSAGPNQGNKTKRRRTKESESSKNTSTTKETSKGNAPTKGSKSYKSVHVEESVAEPTEEVIIDASNDDVVNDIDQPQNDHAPKHNWLTQPLRPPTLDLEWNKGKVVDDSQKHTWFNDLLSAEKGPITFDELMATPIDFFKVCDESSKDRQAHKSTLRLEKDFKVWSDHSDTCYTIEFKQLRISVFIYISPLDDTSEENQMKLDVALELAKSMSRSTSGVVIQDTPNVPKKKSVDQSHKLKASREGMGSEEESEYSEEVNFNEEINWVYFDEEEEKKDDDDDDKSIDIEETNEEETDDDFVHGDEYVQENVDEEMKDAEVVDTWNGDEEITNTTKADAEKIEEVKDDNKKDEIPPSSSSLFVSLVFAEPEKVLRKRDHDGDDKDEHHSARPNHGKKTKRRRTKESESSKNTSTTKETSKGNAPPKGSKSYKSVHVEESVAKPTEEFAMNRLKIDKLTKVHLVGSVYNLLKGTCQSSIELKYNMEEYYKALSDQLNWNNPKGDHCPFDLSKTLPLKGRPEGDFIDLHLNKIEDMILLDAQDKLFQLDESDIVDLVVALRMFTKSLIIKRRVKDVQLGVERVVYEDLNKKKRVMRADDLYKFSDGTLKLVCDELHHRILNFRLGYNKEMSRRKWSAIDKRRSELMVQLVDKQMRERRIIRNLERLVGV
ncbi:hypothetical protein Tco_0405254 [Tanacetum coccineum]